MRRRAARLVLVGTIVFGSVLVPGLALAAPSVNASPDSGWPGTAVAVDGAEFTSGFECSLHLGSPTLPPSTDPTQVGICFVTGDGVLTGDFVVPGEAVGDYTLWACNGPVGNLCSYEFGERASTPFSIIAPPPTTTQAPATPTAEPPATPTAEPPSTTTTTFPEVIADPIDLDVPELLPGHGIGEGLFGPSPPLIIGGGGLEIPSDWLVRCGPLPTSTVWSFDDQSLGIAPQYPPHRPIEATVVQPELGTISLPYAAQKNTSPVGWNHLFDEPIAYFGVHVGLPQSTGGSVVVQIQAQIDDEIIDADRVVLGPEPSPASTCLLVRAPDAASAFNQIVFRASSTSALRTVVDYDDMFFGTDLYPPFEPPNPADVRFLLPGDGDEVRTRRPTVLLGEVRWPQSLGPEALEGVRIVRPTWDRSGLDSALANLTTPVISDAGFSWRAFFWLDGVFVAPGENQVVATAYGTDLAGSDEVVFTGVGPPTPPPDEYRTSVQGIVDIRPWAMEVTQAVRGTLVVQDPGSVIVDDFNHVAAKKTVVRAYGTQQFPGEAPAELQRLEIAALLHGTRDGVTLPGSPLRPEQTPTYVNPLEPGPEGEERQRPYLARTWNFVLPFGWTTEGDVQLRLEVNPVSEIDHLDEAPGTDGAANFIAQRVHFTDVGRITASPIAVDLYFACTDERIALGTAACGEAVAGEIEHRRPSEEQMRNALFDAWKVLPAPGVFPSAIAYSTVRVAEKDPPASIDRSDLGVPLMEGRIAAVDYDTVKTAYQDQNCAWDLRIFHTSLRWPSARNMVMFFNPLDGFGVCLGGGQAWRGEMSAFVTDLSGVITAHEFGHATGLQHAGDAHGAAGARTRWPGDHGELAPPGTSTYGFDTRDNVLIRADDGFHDFMSYGGPPDWVSVGTWNHLFEVFVNNAVASDSRSAEPAGSGDSDVGSRSDGLVISGSMDEEGTAEIGDPAMVRGDAPLGSMDSTILVELRDAAGRTLAAAGALFDERSGSFTAVLPITDGVASIAVLRDGLVVGEVRAGESVISIALGELPDLDSGAVRLEWQATAGLRYLIEATIDGEAWWLLGRTDDPWLDIDPALLPLEGGGGRIRVQATDGVRVVVEEIDGVDFGVRPPVALIGWPGPDEVVPAGMVMASAASLSDVPTDYLWTLDGDPVAVGSRAMLPLVAPGSHEIRLVVENAGGRSETQINVRVIIDDDRDGMEDSWEAARGLDPTDPDDGSSDLDGDGLANVYEHRAGTDPGSVDTDGDDYSDGVEVAAGSNPTDEDSVPEWLGFEDPVAAPRLSDGSQSDEGRPVPWVWFALGAGLVLMTGGLGWLRIRRAR